MIKQGQQVEIKPEWQDAGDDQFTWVAVDDEEKGRVTICPIDSDLGIKPTEIVPVDWLKVTEVAHG